MNQNLVNLQPNKYEIWQQLCNKSIQNKFKSSSTENNLNFLNDIVNGLHGTILLQVLNGRYISKIRPSLVQKKISLSHGKEEIKNYYQYGHIRINNQPIRLSTCLNFDRQIIQFPIYEQQYLKFGQYTFFTCGDLYLLAINSLLENIPGTRKTDKGNYEINISSLFEMNAIYKFGLIDFQNQTFLDDSLHQITKNLPSRFKKINLKGCITGTAPHYILARLENSGNRSTFDYELWTNYKDIYFAYRDKNNIKQWNAYRLQSDKNTNKILKKEKWEFSNIRGKAPGIIKAADDVHYMIFNWQKINNLEEIRKYCHKIYLKYFL
jgi:hypothetical protein